MASKKHLDISKKYCYQSQVSAVALLPPSSVGPSLDLGRLQGKNSFARPWSLARQELPRR